MLRLLLAAAAMSASTAFAQSGDAARPGVAACAAVADDAQRLACYDRAAGRVAPAAGPPAATGGSIAAGAAGTPPTTASPATSVAADAAASPASPAAPAAAASSVSPAAPASPTSPAAPPRGAAAGIAPGAPIPRDSFGPAADDGTPAAGPLLDEAGKTARDARRAQGTTLDERWELTAPSRRGTFLLRPYKPMYVLPAHWTDSPNRQPTSDGAGNTVPVDIPSRAIDAKFQLSFKAKLWETIGGSDVDLWAAYSQASYWQVYSPELSRPFRETNYEPEMFAIWATDARFLGWRTRFLGLGINHQSNGRSEPLSRSWNRVIAQVGLERGDWTVLVRPWWRIQESASVDDNPGIENYIGRGEVVVVRRFGAQIVSAQLRHSLRTGDLSRGSVLLDWAFPVSSYLKAHLQVFSGYGESLIDYNHRQTTIGLGVSLVEWQ